MKSGIFNLWAQMYSMYVLCIDKKGLWSVSSFFPLFFVYLFFSDFHGFYWKEKYLMASDYFTIWLFVL